MTKRNLKIFFLILISITGIFIGYKKAASCTISFEGDDRYVNVFDKSLFNLPDLKPFFLSSHAFADRDERDIEKSAFHNLNKWAEYAKNNATIDDIEAVVYAASLDTLKLIHKAVADNSIGMLPEGYKSNSFVKYLFENKKKEAAEYLVFAKRCEPQVSYYDTWSEHSPDSALKISLFREGQKYCREYHSRFIKDRYAYQTIRLAHYKQQYETAVNLYNRYFGSSVSTDLISNWALAHKAGALMSLGKIPEANLLFAKVFDKCESRRKQAVLSLKLKDEEIINKTLKLCRAPQEKILVYTLSTYNNNIKAVNSLEKIYKIDSRSKYLELLLQRVVTEYERQTIPLREDMYFKNYLSLNRNIVNDIDSGNIIDKNKAYDLICKIAVSKKVHNPYLWNFAAGYMAALQNKYEEAMKFYYEAKRDCPKNDYSYIKRIQAAETIAKINNQGKIDKEFEALILPDLKLIDNLRSTEK
ncbi:MAG: hypothetical protein Q8903_14840, partial [Bacteroidota bacterium]|nr:hypothetical protein [Bacteroidota bacterium]